jgi:hypothetical protein
MSNVNMRAIPILLSLFLLCSCASGPTPYKSIGSGSSNGGYTDRKLIGDEVYEITFIGNKSTPILKVEEYWERRASEICGPVYEIMGMAKNYEEIDLSHSGEAPLIIPGVSTSISLKVKAQKINFVVRGTIVCGNS